MVLLRSYLNSYLMFILKSIPSYIRVLIIAVLLIFIWFHFSYNRLNEWKIDYNTTLRFESTNRQNEHSDMESSPIKYSKSLQICLLISPKLIGWTNLSLETTEAFLKEDKNAFELKMRKAGLKIGGIFQPNECQSRHKVAIIVPIRNRKEHLIVFMRYMHPFLQRQQLNYVIIVVEQYKDLPFNRGMLMNIGYKEVQLLPEKYDCFIFHDVDMLPENDGNPYTCPEKGKPRQMAFSMDYFKNYTPVASGFFGAVTALSATDFDKINGFSNSFWGWGGEDEDFYHRVISQNLSVVRTFGGQQSNLVRYKMQSHRRAVPNPDRLNVMKKGLARLKTDGLINLKYRILNLEFKPLHVHVLVDLLPEKNRERHT